MPAEPIIPARRSKKSVVVGGTHTISVSELKEWNPDVNLDGIAEEEPAPPRRSIFLFGGGRKSTEKAVSPHLVDERPAELEKNFLVVAPSSSSDGEQGSRSRSELELDHGAGRAGEQREGDADAGDHARHTKSEPEPTTSDPTAPRDRRPGDRRGHSVLGIFVRARSSIFGGAGGGGGTADTATTDEYRRSTSAGTPQEITLARTAVSQRTFAEKFGQAADVPGAGYYTRAASMRELNIYMRLGLNEDPDAPFFERLIIFLLRPLVGLDRWFHRNVMKPLKPHGKGHVQMGVRGVITFCQAICTTLLLVEEIDIHHKRLLLGLQLVNSASLFVQ